jgi:HlyD family secretion protein
MKRLLKILAFLIVLGGIGAGLYIPAAKYWQQRNRPQWRKESAEQGDIISVINVTGQVKPVLSIEVGSFVSGPIVDLRVEFNQEVKEKELLAVVDPKLYEASVKRDKANVDSRKADVKRIRAQLHLAERNLRRANDLKSEDPNFISEAETDQMVAEFESLEAQLELAIAAVEQAEANLITSETNLAYTRITAPEDGMIIDRRIDPGQTLAASFQTPVLFIVAPKMREKMHIHASVDETDIGLIRRAQKEQLPVVFTVDAYPEDLFEGDIEEVRYSSTSTQNVVTYPVIIGAANPDLKLLPGMTASISFQVDKRTDVIKIPNAALRFYPQPHRVREEDRKLLEGASTSPEEDGAEDFVMSAKERVEARRQRNTRHVWVVDGPWLKAIEVEVGLSDNRFTELVSGAVTDGMELVTREEAK